MLEREIQLSNYYRKMMQGNPIQDNMNERKNDNEPNKPGADSDTNACKSNALVDIQHVPTKVQDGNAGNFQYEVSPMPTFNINGKDSAAALISSSHPMGCHYYISPMPTTPHAAMDVNVTPTPQSYMSKDTSTLAALYQSSRKPRSSPPTSVHSAAAAPSNARHGFIPPPPLASASPKPEVSSFQPTNDLLNANTWGASGNHNMTGFIQAPNSNPVAIDERTQVQDSQVYNAPSAKEPLGDYTDDSYLTPLLPAKQTVSLAQFEFTPNATMDHQLLDLANESSANMCMEEFSKLRSRSFEAAEEELVLPPCKKYKGDARVDFGDAVVSSMANNISYDAYPTPEARPLTKFEESVQSLIAQSKTKKKPVQEVSFQLGSELKEGHSDKKDQDIIRRKVQRLLLIRHATRCKVPINSDPNADGSQVLCPVTSQCGEGRRLASHIRKCRDINCQYKWCLTTRDVLGHYRSCHDRRCEICGPVRAMHPSRRVKGQVKEP